MAAMASPMPASVASSSVSSRVTMVDSISARSRRLRRPSAGWIARSTGSPVRCRRSAASRPCGSAPEKGMSQAWSGASQESGPGSAPASRSVARAAARMGSSSAAPMPDMRVRTCATPVLLYRGRQTIKNASESESAYRARFFSRAPGFWAGRLSVRSVSIPGQKKPARMLRHKAEHDRGGAEARSTAPHPDISGSLFRAGA